jgi:1,4-dihydroxy-2-naphthoate octaprenyltransferase
MNPRLMVLLVLLALIILSFCWPLLVIVLAAFLAFKIYEAVYFRSSKFKTLKDPMKYVCKYFSVCLPTGLSTLRRLLAVHMGLPSPSNPNAC